MKVQAQSKYLRISARKLRLAADLVRGMNVAAAQTLLSVTNKKAAVYVSATIKSATANAENNYNLDRHKLVIDEIRVDEGPTLKRMRPRAKGASSAILHRSSHLVVGLSDAKPAELAKPKQTKKPAEVDKTPKKEAK